MILLFAMNPICNFHSWFNFINFFIKVTQTCIWSISFAHIDIFPIYLSKNKNKNNKGVHIWYHNSSAILRMTITRKLFSSTDRTFLDLPDEGIVSTKSIKSLWTNYRVFLIELNWKKKKDPERKFRVTRMLHFGTTMPHLGQRKISSEKPLIQPSCTLGPFHCWKLKKSLELIQSHNDASISGPKWRVFGPKIVHLPQMTFFQKKH